MKHLITAFIFLISIGANSQHVYKGNTVKERTPDTVALKNKYAALTKAPRALSPYSPPIYITKGGTYTSNYRSDDPNTPAILVLCYDSVIITGCDIVSAGEGIKAYGGSRLYIHHNNITGLLPSNGSQYGRALNDYQPQTLTFEYNTVNKTGGLMIDHNNENTKSANFRFNIIRNTDKRKTDGSPGDHRASILFNTVTTIASEISWNKFENLPDSSFLEDNINFGNSGGTQASQISIHDNFVKGSYPAPKIYPAVGQVGFSGSGITVEGNGGVVDQNQVSRWINITNNQVVSVGNGGINVNAGHDINVTGNRLISSGMYPDGTPSNIFWGGGATWPGQAYPPESFARIVYKNNTVGWVRPDQNTVYKGQTLVGRNDWVQVAGSPININPDDNISLPNPITLATELAENDIWLKKLKDNGIVVGNTSEVPPIVIPPSSDSVKISISKQAIGTIIVVDSLGNVAPIKPNSASYTTANSKIFTVAKSTSNELQMTVTAVSSGSALGTVSVQSLGGKTITKQFKVTVPDLDAYGIKIEFSTPLSSSLKAAPKAVQKIKK